MAGSGSADVAATAKSGCLKGSKRSDAAYQRREHQREPELSGAHQLGVRWLRPCCRTQGGCATRSTSSGVQVGNVKMCGPPSAPSLVQSASYSISILKPLGGGTANTLRKQLPRSCSMTRAHARRLLLCPVHTQLLFCIPPCIFGTFLSASVQYAGNKRSN